MRASKLSALTCLVVLGLSACKPKGTVDPSIVEASQRGAWAVYEALEARIATGEVSDADRVAALEEIRAGEDDGSARYAYARAAVAGRVAELRGLQALAILEEMRTWALESISRDAAFEDMAAQRLLGTLYVLAGNHLEAGDSEDGIELLESVVDAHPDDPVNHLRLAEGYIALGDPDPAIEGLCIAASQREVLREEERRLLAQLFDDLGAAEESLCE